MRRKTSAPRQGGLFHLFLLLAFGSAVASSVLAEAPDRLSLSAVLAEAHARNPELQAAQGRAKAMAAMPRQVSAYDDPTVSWEAWNTPESLRINRADNNIFRISQKIPFPGKRRLAGEIASHEADQATHEVDTVALDVTAAVKRAFFDLWQSHEQLAVYTRDRGLVERLTRTVEQKYAAGDAGQAEVLRAQVKLTHLTNRLETERLNIEHAEAELNALLSRSPDEPLGVPERPGRPQLTGTPGTLTEVALGKRPDIAAQDAAIAREESAARLAGRGYYPDFEVSVGRFINFEQSDGFGAMASVTVPIFNGAKYGAAVDEAAARLATARSEKRRVEDRIRREVEQAYVRARRAFVQFELFDKTHIPQAEQALRVTEGGYESGAVSFLDLIDTLRSIETVHLEHVAAQADFERAYADLELAVGSDVPRQPAIAPAATSK